MLFTIWSTCWTSVARVSAEEWQQIGL
jgi:hypothetical protein